MSSGLAVWTSSEWRTCSEEGAVKPVAILVLVVVVVAASVVGLLVLLHSPEGPQVRPSEADMESGDTPGAAGTAPSPQEAALQKMRELNDASDRLDHLEWISRQDWARSDLPVLRTTIISDPSEEVQLAALDTALRLAGGEGTAAATSVVKTSLASTKGNTRARGLKAARENPDAELVPTLIELVDNQDAYATMALNALAYTPSPKGHAKILAIAEDESADRKLRERAIALLAVTKDREALTLLTELANGKDEALSKLAVEVLKALSE